ncbi:MAG: ROK family protein [Suipraeoptans sp.]
MGNSTLQLRVDNRNLILQYVKAHNGVTKSEVSNKTKLSQGTVNTILNQLKEESLVCETSDTSISGGRPASKFVLNADYCHVCCLYLEEKASDEALIHYQILNLIGKSPLAEEIRIKNITPAKLIDFISMLKKRDEKIHAVSIGIPGIVDNQGNLSHCDFSAFTEISLAKFVHDSLAIDVRVENDVTLMAKGVANMDNLSSKTAAILYFPKSSPLGVGLICDGRIIRGSTGFAGELSFLPPGFRNLEEPTSADEIAYMINVLTCVLNPEEIVLTGERIANISLTELENICLKSIPLKHLPTLKYKSDITEYYYRGLWELIEENYLIRLGEG